MAHIEQSAPAGGVSFGAPSYRLYVLLLLTLVYTLNFIDRTLLSVVGQPVIDTFNLSDSQYGFLNGPPFAIFYAVMGIPIAMLADRYNRVVLIAVCIAVWSLMAALCGFATSFLFLLFARVGVAIGEAGCTPPANSLIGDYFKAKSRANALGIYAMGVTIGGALAYGFGGPIATHLTGIGVQNWLESIHFTWAATAFDWSNIEGWRIAFVVFGAPGLLIALIVLFTIKEPPRGYSDPPGARKQDKSSFRDTLRELVSKRSFWTLTTGASLTALVGYGVTAFQAPMMQRLHGVTAGEFALEFGVPLSLCAAAGTFVGGLLTERITPIWKSAAPSIPGIALLIAVPLYITAFTMPTENLALSRVLWCIGAFFHYGYISGQYNVGQGIVSARSRASAIAILLFAIAVIGNGLGPWVIGALSDIFMQQQLATLGFAEDLSAAICHQAETTNLTDAQAAACQTAYAGGLRLAMVSTVLIFIPAGLFFLATAGTYKRDLVATPV